MPWMIAGVFNINVDEVQRSMFIKKIHGHVVRAPIQCTQVGGTGDYHIDFVVASSSCVPYIREVSAVLDVPWAPH
eukprot:1097168-Pyramimonas_sp.AAC.1